MSLRECTCPAPEPKPQRPQTCVRCGYWINPAWAISLENTRAYLARLEECLPAPPESFQRFEAQVLRRQQQGEFTFRQSGHGRDMQANGNEEATDLAMYAVIGLLQERRARTEENIDLGLQIGIRAADAYDLNEMWKGKHRGRAHAARAHDEEE